MPQLRFYTLWAINAPLDEQELCRQLDQMRAFDYDGAVFHPRFYPNTPPYLGDEYLAILSDRHIAREVHPGWSSGYTMKMAGPVEPSAGNC